MSKSGIKIRGVVKSIFPNFYLIMLDNNLECKAVVSGYLKHKCISILEGDKVFVEFTPYSFKNGIIISRERIKK